MMLMWSYAIRDGIQFTLMKTRFFHLFFSKCLNASVATQLGIPIRAAQRWVKRYYKDSESIFEKKKKSGQHRILGEEHR
jgi:hypothetical protein